MIRSENSRRYDANYQQRLTELRTGDPAYDQHLMALAESLIFAWDNFGEDRPPRIIDVGCGLGFGTKELSQIIGGTEVVGVDPASGSITAAKQEHPGLQFTNQSIEDFADDLEEQKGALFDQAVLNMVVHSVSEVGVISILKSVHRVLHPGGIIHLVLPNDKWLMRKLITNAQKTGMDREAGIKWVHEQLQLSMVELRYKLQNGKYYPQPLLIFNRSLDDYARMLIESGFGVLLDWESGQTELLPYWKPQDYTVNYELKNKQREVLMSFALEKI